MVIANSEVDLVLTWGLIIRKDLKIYLRFVVKPIVSDSYMSGVLCYMGDGKGS